jgi:hypothetical protein
MGDEAVQQIVRIIMYFLTGALATKGITEGAVLVQVAAIVTGVVSLGWWFFWNRLRKP